MVLIRNLLVLMLSVVFLASCVKQPPTVTPASDVGGEQAGPQSSSADAPVRTGKRAEVTRADNRSSGDALWREIVGGSAVEFESAEIPLLNLALPKGSEGVNHLFTDRDKGPNYFKSSRESKESETVRFKGKLYMIEDPAAEKRIQNVDGGEVGIVVPFK